VQADGPVDYLSSYRWHSSWSTASMLNQSLTALGAIALLAACGPTGLSATGASAPSAGEPCAFQILTAPPSGGYVEVGVVNAQVGDFGSNAFSTLADFRKKIAPDVCRVGGDMAVVHANDSGIYIRATILKSAPATAPAAPPTALAAPPTAPAAPPTAPGCQFDMQCKGDRLCVRGECADPPNR
jgi:hypothetical protein